MRPELGPTEQVVGSWRVNHSQGRGAIGGMLYLTNERVLFVPTRFERLFRHEVRAWQLRDLSAAKVAPRKVTLLSANGSDRRRLSLTFRVTEELFVLNKVDDVAAAFAEAVV